MNKSEIDRIIYWVDYAANTGDHAQAVTEITKIKQAQTEEERLDLMEIGTDLGIFAFVNMLLDGQAFDREVLKKVSEYCAAHIEEVSGMPAVVFSMMTKPAIEQMINKAKEGQ